MIKVYTDARLIVAKTSLNLEKNAYIPLNEMQKWL
jgi:hypothetical protein